MASLLYPSHAQAVEIKAFLKAEWANQHRPKHQELFLVQLI